ncbi:hypothetical protein [Actinomadura fibrosa]|uniref:Uncharacterized protein n=1 Tax=Actinomadura fibrosa TaxID=111802 RepID=A0ABW2XDV3_9ACTN
MAYFVLPGKGKRVYRLAIARRIVDGTARRDRSPAGLARRRTRVLRRAMRPSRRLQIGLGPWLRAVPARLPDPALTGALARLSPHVRAAYVLRHVEGLPRYAVRDQLIELGVRDPWPVIAAADAVEVPAARRPERFDPALMRPVRNRSVLPLATAAVLTTVLVGALVMTETDGSLAGGSRPARGRALQVVSADPGAWSRGGRTLDAWPARGDLAADHAFTRRAADAWAAVTGGRRARGGAAQLVYAGRAAGVPVAILRNGDRLARYTPGRSLDVVTAGGDPSAPIALGGGRYLLAPWDRRAETLTGKAVDVRDGVTAPALARTPCGRGPVLRLKGPDGRRTVGDLGGPRAAVLTYHSPAYRPPVTEPAAPTALGPKGLALWERLSCLTGPVPGPVTEAMAWEFWSGDLPHGGAAAGWVCTRLTSPAGATTRATLIGARDAKSAEDGSVRAAAVQYPTGACDDRRPVSGTWWQAPTGRWYYLAAAARGLTPRAEGPFRTSGTDDRLFVATPADPASRPGAAVSLTAR